jgi:hypothetical protein
VGSIFNSAPRKGIWIQLVQSARSGTRILLQWNTQNHYFKAEEACDKLGRTLQAKSGYDHQETQVASAPKRTITPKAALCRGDG